MNSKKYKRRRKRRRDRMDTVLRRHPPNQFFDDCPCIPCVAAKKTRKGLA